MSIADIDVEVEREDLLAAGTAAAVVAEHADLSAGTLAGSDFESFLNAVNDADNLCIEYHLT